MDQNDELASLKESIRIFERLTAAARLAAVYSDKKKILRYVYKTLKFERKQFGRSCYPLTDGYSGTILLMFSEFTETLEKLLGARRPEDYTRAYARLEEVLTRIFEEYAALNAALAEKAAEKTRASAIEDFAGNAQHHRKTFPPRRGKHQKALLKPNKKEI